MTKNDKLARAIVYLQGFVHGVTAEEVIKDLESLKTKPKKDPVKKEYSLGVINCFNNCLIHFPSDLYPKDPLTWYEVIDKLNRIDDVEFKEIERVVAAVRADKWWCKNFQSMVKLRKPNREFVQYFVSFQNKFPAKNKVHHSNFAEDTSSFDQ